eukprot:7527382-Ditylum_brightwellii.AAC.1
MSLDLDPTEHALHPVRDMIYMSLIIIGMNCHAENWGTLLFIFCFLCLPAVAIMPKVQAEMTQGEVTTEEMKTMVTVAAVMVSPPFILVPILMRTMIHLVLHHLYSQKEYC